MTAKNRFEREGTEERSMHLAKLSLEELLYYVLVELRGNGPDAARA
jgi:hypothetical protein